MKSDILLKYEDKWVALNKNRDKVLFVAKTVNGLYKILSKKDSKNIILHYVMPFNGTLAPLRHG